ncbi:MAG: radical SAM protein [Candidatus Omnitrophica bacterium]|nr:radical SAM protein [Candidatus Omnitrophota bacterium]MBU4473456.1 radical SAM protein [Candidatus Omnitrophota bacterium]MCG2706209.1 radical SAM protein [Candidatus Omnitrophota bacterium]
MYPAYLKAGHNGTLKQLCEQARKMLESCSICPRRCKVNRLKGEQGFCKTGLLPKVCSFMPHHGEEPPISGERGSGTIFFSHCNMACTYCQNYEFSQLEEGREVEFEELAGFMLQLQDMGCHNINFVTPTHVMPQILQALIIAIPKGLKIPLVYNTGGYELAQVIKLLDGIVDIYMPDMRYADNDMAVKYSQAPDYPQYNQQALEQMHRQVGVADRDNAGIIRRGLIIRHLVLPQNISGTEKIMQFIAGKLSPEAYISLMSQYLPCYKAEEFPEINRRITSAEYEAAQKIMRACGLNNGWIQESHGLDRFAGTNIKPI